MLIEARVSVYSVDLPGKGGGYRRTTAFRPPPTSAPSSKSIRTRGSPDSERPAFQ